jgi:hypothetical protein
MQAVPHWRLGDLAANAADRVHMMGRDPDFTSRMWKGFDAVSKLQGHGALAGRTDLAPVLRFAGVTYRRPLRAPVELLDVPVATYAAARRAISALR